MTRKQPTDSKYTTLPPPTTGNTGVEEDRGYTSMPPLSPRQIDGLNRSQAAADPQTLVARLQLQDISKLDNGKKALEDLGFIVIAGSSRVLSILGEPNLYSSTFGVTYEKGDDGQYRVTGTAVMPSSLEAYFSGVYLPTKPCRFP